jgi:hypothetical protein
MRVAFTPLAWPFAWRGEKIAPGVTTFLAIRLDSQRFPWQACSSVVTPIVAMTTPVLHFRFFPFLGLRKGFTDMGDKAPKDKAKKKKIDDKKKTAAPKPAGEAKSAKK